MQMIFGFHESNLPFLTSIYTSHEHQWRMHYYNATVSTEWV